MLIEIILLGGIKVLDNVISTAKNITVYQNKKILTSLLVVISQFLFYFVIKSVVSDGSIFSISVVCICSGIGTYVAMFINDKFKKDTLYTNILTCDEMANIDELCDYLSTQKIKYIPFDSYDRNHNRTKTVLIFANTKYQSSLVDKFTSQSKTKYLRQILK